jgi:uncharacterized tellurite resistance protein B-like protein
MVQEGIPIPPDWALAWYCSAPNPPVYLRTAATRCEEEFRALFAVEYTKAFGNGLKITRNKTNLSLTYHPASKSLLRTKPYIKELGLPDVTVLNSPLAKIGPIIQSTLERLDSYSRYIGRNPDNIDTLDALLELPSTIWPDLVKSSFEKLKRDTVANGGMNTLKFVELVGPLPQWKDRSKKRMTLFCEAIANFGLGIEPDPRFGDPLPDENSKVVLFALDENPLICADSKYAMAALTLFMSMNVSQVDGVISDKEVTFLVNKIESWTFINITEKIRLKAYLQFLRNQDLQLSGIKKRLDSIGTNEKVQIGDILIQVAKSDQVVSIQELKLLERLYKLLGIDKSELYIKIHATASEPVNVYTPVSEKTGFAIPKNAHKKPISGPVIIDMTKVAELQADSEQVTAILNNIFNQPEVETESLDLNNITDEIDDNSIQTIPSTCLWGLPQDISDFVRVLSGKPFWNKIELEEIAEDRGIMLEGALEQINEAAYDMFDNPYTDGLDTIEINKEIMAVINQ